MNGNNSIFKFAYDRFATIDEAAADYIVKEEGAIAVRDGAAKVQIGGSMGSWEVLVPSLQTIGAFKLDKAVIPADYDLSSDGMELSVKLSREEALAVLGVVIEAQGEILLEAESNGKNVSMVVVSYTSASGAAVRIATSAFSRRCPAHAIMTVSTAVTVRGSGRRSGRVLPPVNLMKRSVMRGWIPVATILVMVFMRKCLWRRWKPRHSANLISAN